MEEIVFWKEVDVKDELPEVKHGHFIVKETAGHLHEAYFKEGNWFISDEKEMELYNKSVTHWLKRVVIPILSDQEIEPKADKHIESGIYFNVAGISDYKLGKHQGFIEGYKAMQERLIGGQGL